MSRNLVIIAGIVALLGAIGATLYFAEWKEFELPGQPSEEARRNPYMAAERFLANYKVKLHAKSGLSLLDQLPPTGDLIVIGSSLRTASPRRLDALMAWVERGGRLLVLAREFSSEREYVSEDPILGRVGVLLRETEVEEPSNDEEGDGEEEARSTQQRLEEVLRELELSANQCEPDERLTPITLEGEAVSHRVALTSDRYVDHEPGPEFAVAANAAGAQLVATGHQAGMVYVITTLSLWNNRYIGCHDNAHFLRWLAEGREGVWLLFDTEMPSIFEILWSRYSLAIVLLSLFLLLWLWRGAPPQKVPVVASQSRRSVLEHVTGMARFHWQQGEERLLIEDVRRSTLRGTVLQEAGAREEWLASMAHLIDEDVEQLRWALFEEIPRDAQAIKRMVRVLIKVNRNK